MAHRDSTTPMLGLRTVVYRVPDLAAAKDWYSRAFEMTAYFDQPFYVGFNIGGYELGLLPLSDSESGEGHQQPAENVLCYWGVEDIEAQVARLLELGASSHEAPVNVGGPIVIASLRDPWGNVIGLIHNPTFTLPA